MTESSGEFKNAILPYEKGAGLTQAEFDDMLAGKTRTRFKIIVNPSNGKIYRLVRHDVGISPAYYVEMEPKPATVYEYELGQAAKESYATKALEPLPRHYSIKSYTIQLDPKKQAGEGELSRVQFFELEKAVSLSSRWWPMEGLSWNSPKHLQHTQVNILYHGRMPIGFVAIEDSGQEAGRPVKSISMVGLMPGHRGSGHGNYLVRWAITHILENAPDAKIVLTTSDLDKKQDGKPVRNLYEKLGFELKNTTLVDPAQLIAQGRADLLNVDMFSAYAPDTYDEDPKTGRKLPHYTSAELERRVRSAFGMERG